MMRPLCWSCHQTVNYLIMNKIKVDGRLMSLNKEVNIKELRRLSIGVIKYCMPNFITTST